MKGLRRLGIIGLALLLALGLFATTGGATLASELSVDQKAELSLMAKMEGSSATGDAKLELRINGDGTLDKVRASVDAEGLVAGVGYAFFVGHIFVGCAIADDNGTISIDEELTDFGGYTTLLGLKVKVKTMDGVVLFGKVMAGDLDDALAADIDEEEG